MTKRKPPDQLQKDGASRRFSRSISRWRGAWPTSARPTEISQRRGARRHGRLRRQRFPGELARQW